MTRTRGDDGSIVLGWLTKLALTLGVLGLVVFDGAALVAARFQVEDAAATAARAAAESYRSSRSVQQAYDAALAEVADSGDTVGTADFAVAPDGRVTLSVTRTAETLVLEKIGPLERFTTTTATGSGTATS